MNKRLYAMVVGTVLACGGIQRCEGQPSDYAVLAQAGIATLGRTDLSRGAPTWKLGPIVGGGFLVRRSELLSVLATLDYAQNRLVPPSIGAFDAPVTTRHVDVSGMVRLTRGPFSLLAGAGFAYQFTGAYLIVYQDGTLSASSAASELDFFLTGGLAAEFPLSGRTRFVLQGGGRLRTYGSWTVEAGVLFDLIPSLR